MYKQESYAKMLTFPFPKHDDDIISDMLVCALMENKLDVSSSFISSSFFSLAYSVYSVMTPLSSFQ